MSQKSLDEETIIGLLRNRFEKNTRLTGNINWPSVEKKLRDHPEKLQALIKMEETGGQPELFKANASSGEFIFYDCSPESPDGRRSLCFDREALESRKKFPPEDSAVDLAAAIGIELLSEEEYRELQQHRDYDTKTSSWIKTPEDIRELGGALFADRRYDHVFVYHNGASSYYAARGFRGKLKV